MCGQGKGARWDLAGFQFAHLQVAIFFAQRECTLVVVAVRETARAIAQDAELRPLRKRQCGTLRANPQLKIGAICMFSINTPYLAGAVVEIALKSPHQRLQLSHSRHGQRGLLPVTWARVPTALYG